MDFLLASLILTSCVIAASANRTSSVHQAIGVEVGETLHIRCPSSGSANASWYKNDEGFRSSEPRIRVLRESVKFRRVGLEDGGIYGCKIVNGGVAEWTNVSVTVQNPAADLQRDEPFGGRDNLGNHRTKREDSGCLTGRDADCDWMLSRKLPCLFEPDTKKTHRGYKFHLLYKTLLCQPRLMTRIARQRPISLLLAINAR